MNKNQRLKRNKSNDNEIQIESNKNNYYCTFNGCCKVFKSQKTLNQHIKRHNKPYQCNYNGCNKVFGSSWDRNIHVRTHTGEKQEKCSFCLYSFSDPSSLRRHIKRFHPQ